MITFNIEPYTDNLLAELYPLFRLSWKESPIIKGYDMEIDWDTFKILAEDDAVEMVVVRNENGFPIGYCHTILSRSLHNKQMTVAIVDSIYLNSRYRKGFNGIKFLKYLEEEYLSRYDSFIVAVRQQNDFSKLLLRRGYEMVETQYCKRCTNG